MKEKRSVLVRMIWNTHTHTHSTITTAQNQVDKGITVYYTYLHLAAEPARRQGRPTGRGQARGPLLLLLLCGCGGLVAAADAAPTVRVVVVVVVEGVGRPLVLGCGVYAFCGHESP